MAANMQRPLRNLPANLLQYTPAHIFAAQGRLALAPDLDALQQRSAGIVTRLPNSQYRVQMNMGIDKRRRKQPAACVNLASRTPSLQIAGNLREAPLFDRQIKQPGTPM